MEAATPSSLYHGYSWYSPLPRDANAGPPIVTGSIILTQEQLLNMSVICAALVTHLSVVNM
jgi:hypothetical protein